MRPEAIAAVMEGMARWANPSSPHAEGRAARAALEDARKRIAKALDWPHHVILTSGASESAALALRGRPGVAVAAVVESVTSQGPSGSELGERRCPATPPLPINFPLTT